MQPATLPQIQKWNTKKRCGFFLKLTMKTSEEHQYFLMSPCQWGCSDWYSCTWIWFNIYLPVIYFIWYTVRYTMRQTGVTTNVTRSTKLWGAQCSPELSFRSTGFCVPENLLFPALMYVPVCTKNTGYVTGIMSKKNYLIPFYRYTLNQLFL